MAYQVLALKYRPQTFDEVVGQSHVTDTLVNAISSNRVAHAILFTGPRGTGKTTIARILAKAMNCKLGPLPQPCNNCKICKNIIEGHCTDVFEIDGASNNSVDQIRDLRQNVTYMPSLSKYKIYIIDEVHMLSTAAFNALLKTLEEPPKHVMFIFATTEAHKIPATILSRCQRHDLSRIGLSFISDHLKKLSENEGYSIEKQSLDLIAQEADGSIRDGLSLLDRILSAAQTKEIDIELVLTGLGIQDQQIMHDISSAIFNQNGTQLIETIEKANSSGIDLKKFYLNIIYHFRNYNIIKLCGKDTPAANITELEKEKIIEQTSNYSSGYISTILQTLLNQESIVQYSSHTKIAIEMVLLKLLEINPGAQIDKIISKLDVLSKQMDAKLRKTANTFEPVQKSDTEIQKKALNSEINAVQEPAPKIQYQSSSSPIPETAPVLDPIQKNNLPEDDLPEDHLPEDDLPKDDLPEDHLQQNKYEAKTWHEFLKKIEQKFPFMFALFSKGCTKKENDEEIIIELKNCSSFDKDRIKNKKTGLAAICKDFLGKDLKIKIVSQNNNTAQDNNNNENQKRDAAFNHPMVVEAQQMFNGEIIR